MEGPNELPQERITAQRRVRFTFTGLEMMTEWEVATYRRDGCGVSRFSVNVHLQGHIAFGVSAARRWAAVRVYL